MPCSATSKGWSLLDKLTSKQWFLLKIAALLACVPVVCTFYAAALNNAQLGMKDIVFVYGYICLFSLGWPLWTLFFTYEIFRRRIRGVRWMRNVSIIWLVIFLPAAIYGFYDPHFVDSNMTPPTNDATVRERIASFAILLPALFPAWYGWKIMRLVKAES